MPDPKFHTKTEPKTLKFLADLIDVTLLSDAELLIHDVSPLSSATSNDISFLDNIKYKDDFANTKAGACIVSKKMAEFAPKNCAVLISDHPYKSYAIVAQSFYPQSQNKGEISDFAHIHPTAKIGKNCFIAAGAVIDKHVEIGDGTKIGANASISHSIIGQNCHIYPGVRIGQDGFGFAIDPKGHVKVPQLGRVLIGDHVEIGANSCIDRGAGPDTIIGDGTWIDNLVQIGHNVKIGRGCIIIAQAGIAGSTILEDYAVIAAQVGIAGHLNIGMAAKVAAQSGVMKDVPAKTDVMGSPAQPIKQHLRQVAFLKKAASQK